MIDEEYTTITELMKLDKFADKKGRWWIRKEINAKRLKAISTGTDTRPTYYVKLSDWTEFKESLEV